VFLLQDVSHRQEQIVSFKIRIAFICQQQKALGFIQAKGFFRLFDLAVCGPNNFGLERQRKEAWPPVLAYRRQGSHIDDDTAEDANQISLHAALCQLIKFLAVRWRKDLLLQAFSSAMAFSD
jgi:hypothetical protein